MVLACETGSRWHHRVLTMVSKFIGMKTQTAAPLSCGGIEKEQQLKTLSQEKSELAQKSSRLESELEELTAPHEVSKLIEAKTQPVASLLRQAATSRESQPGTQGKSTSSLGT